VRKIDGQEFLAILRERRWQTFDFTDLEASADLKALAALVSSLIDSGKIVRVWMWHSQ